MLDDLKALTNQRNRRLSTMLSRLQNLSRLDMSSVEGTAKAVKFDREMAAQRTVLAAMHWNEECCQMPGSQPAELAYVSDCFKALDSSTAMGAEAIAQATPDEGERAALNAAMRNASLFYCGATFTQLSTRARLADVLFLRWYPLTLAVNMERAHRARPAKVIRA